MKFKLPKIFAKTDQLPRRPDTRTFGRTGEARYIPRFNRMQHGKVLANRYDQVSLLDYDRARFYPAVRDALETIIGPLKRVNFHFVCADQTVADLAMQELQDHTRRLIVKLLRGGMAFGYQAVEKVWIPKFEVELSSGQAGTGERAAQFPFIWTIARFKSFDPSDTRILLDARSGLFGGIEQYTAAGGDRRRVPSSKCILYTHDEEFDTLYGVARTKAAIPFVELAESIYDDMATFSKVFAVPWKKGRHKPGMTVFNNGEGASVEAENASLMNDLMQSIESGHNVSLPAEFDPKTGLPLWELDIIQPPAEDRYVEKLEHVNAMIRLAIVVPEMASSNSPDSGTYNLGQAVIDLFLANAEGYLDEISTVLNEQLLKDFAIFNFGSDCPPLTLKFEPLDVKVKTALLTGLISQLVQGLPLLDSEGNELSVDWGKIGEDNGVPLAPANAHALARRAAEEAIRRLQSANPDQGGGQNGDL